MKWRCVRCGARYPEHRMMCTGCFQPGLVIAEPERARAETDDVIEMTNARDLSKATWTKVPITAYPDLQLSRGAMVVLLGAKGSGKSSMLARMLDTVTADPKAPSPPVMLYSAEEPAGPSVAERLARVGVVRENFSVCSRATVDQLAGEVSRRKIVALGIDSVQRAMFEPRELRHLLLTLPSLAMLVCVSQVNRDGDVHGGTELGHECDALIEVQKGADDVLRWKIVKSRYQENGEGEVLASAVSPTEDKTRGARVLRLVPANEEGTS